MSRIVIVGGGFAGAFAAKTLMRSKPGLTVTLVDRRESHESLPLLPDILGRSLRADAIRYPLGELAERHGFHFHHGVALSVEPAERRLQVGTESLEYDYLLLAPGSQTNLRQFSDRRDWLHTLDSVDDAVRLRRELDVGKANPVVVAGGSYTGVETATHARRFLREHGKEPPIYLLNRGPRTCRSLPEKFSAYIERELARQNIQVLSHCIVEEAQPHRVVLSTGECFDDAPLLVWTAGVQPPPFVQELPFPHSADGRLLVESDLRVDARVFVAGDAAYFLHNGEALRMGVQFAIGQGVRAARNILRLLSGKRSRTYRPVDLGYVVPMGHFRGCGVAIGVPMKGRKAMLLHYTMCLYRSLGWANRYHLLKELLIGR
jgi:NADH dehydrogenase